jgi:hypothetical protein
MLQLIIDALQASGGAFAANGTGIEIVAIVNLQNAEGTPFHFCTVHMLLTTCKMHHWQIAVASASCVVYDSLLTGIQPAVQVCA